MPVSNLGRIGFVTKGDWSAGIYKYLDVVKHVAATWICAVPTTSEEPGTGTHWQNALTTPAVTGITEWSQLSGTQSPPLIVYDDQKYWTLIATVSDIAANKPSESPDFFIGKGTAASRDVTESAVDTTAGRVLKVGDFGLGSGDLHGLVDGASTGAGARTQFFRADSEDRPTEWNAGHLETQPIGGWVVSRGTRPLAFLFPNSPRLFVSHRGASSWSTPVEFYTQRNVLGTVSESGGVPTGAIIERGSNANGEFVKYADGTLIMRRVATVNLAANSQATFNLPAVFAGAGDDVSVGLGWRASMANDVQRGGTIPMIGNPPTVWVVRNTTGTAYASEMLATLIAIGRWY